MTSASTSRQRAYARQPVATVSGGANMLGSFMALPCRAGEVGDDDGDAAPLRLQDARPLFGKSGQHVGPQRADTQRGGLQVLRRVVGDQAPAGRAAPLW